MAHDAADTPPELGAMLASLVAALNSVHPDPTAVSSLLDHARVRRQDGGAIEGFEHAVWFPIRRPTAPLEWEIIDDQGDIRVVLSPPSLATHHQWTFRVLPRAPRER